MYSITCFTDNSLMNYHYISGLAQFKGLVVPGHFLANYIGDLGKVYGL